MERRSFKSTGQWRTRGAFGLLIFLCGCAGSIGALAVDAGRKILFDRAEKNFGSEYSSDLGKLIDLITVKTVLEEPTPVEAGAVEPEEPAQAQEQLAPELEPIELELVVARHLLSDGRSIPVPLPDGAVLRDGEGRPGEGDDLKIQFRVNVPCYIYAVWIDATAWATPIFPHGPGYTFANPVEPDRGYEAPEGDGWFYLDGHRGVENLYFLAFREAQPELDALLADLKGRERAFLPDVVEVAAVDEPHEITRGLAGVRPGAAATLTSTDGSDHQVASQTFVSQVGSADLVVTRWFRHE
jgi:hypothetical protein